MTKLSITISSDYDKLLDVNLENIDKEVAENIRAIVLELLANATATKYPEPYSTAEDAPND